MLAMTMSDPATPVTFPNGTATQEEATAAWRSVAMKLNQARVAFGQ